MDANRYVMKHIRKRRQPPAFARWKARASNDWHPGWNILQNPEKRIVKQALLEEQGGICAYCCQRITNDTSHIDHVVPRTVRPGAQLDFMNMVASCSGEPEAGTDYPSGEARPSALIHCGHKKGDWYDPEQFVDPREPACEDAFSFDARGHIHPEERAPTRVGARVTIDMLNLDAAPLRRQREAAVAVELERLASILRMNGLLSVVDVRLRIDRIKTRDASGRFFPFLPAVIDVLQRRARSLA